MTFRPDINGLRAFAVLAVVLYHFGVPFASGGFVGVDVFFVISGFLMASIVFPKMAAGRFSLPGFYMDRAWRIMPALIALCAGLLVLGWFILASGDYQAMGRQVLYAVVFLSNIIFFRETGYFESLPHENWVLHSWSLSVEWQFYLIYPLLILLLRKWLAPRALTAVLAALAALSFLFCCYVSLSTPAAAFYLLPFRAWEMLLGSLVFLLPVALEPGRRKLLEWGGFGLIVGSVLAFNGKVVWPGWWAAVPTAGAVMMIMAARTESRLTGNPLAQFLGKISYSVYLWHWPVMAALSYYGRLPLPVWAAAGIVVALLLGYLSYRWIETPARTLHKSVSLPRLPIMQPAVLLLGAALVVVLGGGVIQHLQGVPGDIRLANSNERTLYVEKYRDMARNDLVEPYRLECDFYDGQYMHSKPTIDPSCVEGKPGTGIFLWGDSHAQALSHGLREYFPDQGGTMAQVATSACGPSLGPAKTKPTIDNNCDYSNRYALRQIARLRPAVVVMAQAAGHEGTDWDEIAHQLHTLGVKKVFLMGPMPNWRPSLPLVVARSHWWDPDPYVDFGLEGTPQATDAILSERYHASSQLTYVSIIHRLCRADGCLAFVPGGEGLMVVDYGHLSPAGSAYVVRSVLGPPVQLALSDTMSPALKWVSGR